MSDSKLLTVKEVAEILSCSESLIRRPDMKNVLEAIVIGKRALRFRKEVIEQYLENQKTEDSYESNTEAHNKPKRTKLTSRHGLW